LNKACGSGKRFPLPDGATAFMEVIP
jgi:hypothetical protein